MENNENERSTLFTARNAESAMTFFTVVGFLTLVVIFVYHRFHGNKTWDTALILVWERVPHVLAFSTLLTIFKEGVDVMLMRLKEYNDRRKRRIAKEVKEKVAKEVEKIVGKAKEEAYQKGYEAAKAESRSQEKKSS